MTVFCRSFFFLMTCLLASIGALLAQNNPPLLTNPSACGLNLFITEAGCGPANEFQINVATAPGTVLGGNVYLKELRFTVEHGWAADLDIHLKSPAGVIVEISTDNGDAFDNYGNPNDTACTEFTRFLAHSSLGACNLPEITDGQAPFIGAYLPEGNFSDFNDGSSPIGHWTLIICDDGASNLGYLQFVELVFESTGCVAPTEVTVLKEDSTSVQLDWVTGSTCDDVVIEFGPVGFTPGTGAAGIGGTVVVGDCPPFVLNGLLPTTQYDIYLRENCGSNQFSFNACPVQAMTTCSPPPATIIEDFNAQALCQPLCGVTCPMTGPFRNASNDNFDWLVNSDTTLTALTGPPGDYPGGGNYAYLEASGSSCRNGKRAVLVSNCIQVVANADSCDMSFDYNFHGVHINGMSLEATTDGGATWETLWNGSGNKGVAWKKKFIDLDAYSGMTVQFRFVGRGGSGQFADLALDNIVFYGSIDLGTPSFVNYLDADGDGYGNPDLFIGTCQPASFAGYVANADDCDDSDFNVNPGQMETLCDDFDSNCNGDTDEYFVVPVLTESSVVCSGANAVAVAFPANFGEISWYDSLTGGQVIAVGDTLFPSPNLLINNGLDTIVLHYFAEENTLNGCVSNERTEATITILPSPRLFTADAPGECFGKEFDLTTIDILDENGLNGSLRYFDQFPLVPGNEVGPIVVPTATTTYHVLSEAANGCRDTLNVTYTVTPGPVADIPGEPTLCRNSSKTIAVNNNGNGTGPFHYVWNNGETTTSIEIFSDNIIGSVKTYAVTISDATGCSSADSLVVTTIENIEQLLTSSTSVTTCNGDNGSVSVTPLDGNAPFTYEWAGGIVANQPGGLTVTGLEQGSYSFTVTDSSPEQCRAVVPTVVVNGPAAIVMVDEVQDVHCFGGTDGCISLTVFGGGNTTIDWDNGMQGAQICGLNAGIYTATITEGSCENIISIPISQPEPLLVNPEATPVSCFGGNDGALRLNIFGGSPPISYQWSNGANTPINTNLAAGNYDLTVTDVRGCEIVLPQIQVHQPLPISLASLGFQLPSCNGLSDGGINVEAGGGVAPFAYAWSNGGAGTAISNIAAGSYTVSVRDQNGCEFSQAINLTQPQPLAVVSDGIQMPSCAGLENGAIQTETSGGTGSYFFLWNNGATTPDLTGIANGEYSVTVTDDNGCTTSTAFAPISSPSVLAPIINQSAPLCIGREENCLEATVLGGMPPYLYDWSTDDSGPVLCNLSHGHYTVTITDSNGCKATRTTTIDSIQVLTLGYEAFPPLCNGQVGQLAMTVSGGTTPYQVIWSDGQTGLVASNLLAQNHAATVTDANGCSNTLGIIPLAEPEPLEIEVANLEHIACHNGSEGAIDISVSGGTQPYHFQWSNAANSEDLSSLPEGEYSVVITDDNGCTSSIQGLSIVSPAPLAATADLGLPSGNCQTLQVEDLCIVMEGGIGPYHFDWDTGDSTTCLIDPLPGDYHVTITDAVGCTIELMSVKVPDEYNAISLEPLPSQQTVCFGDSTGQLNLTILGGIAPYQYNWSNGITGISSFQNLTNSNLPLGSYKVTITDNTGCTAVSPTLSINSYGLVVPTVNTNLVQHVHCRFGADGAIPLSVMGGLAPYDYHWEDANGNAVPGETFVSNLTAGTYSVTVTDHQGCTGTVSSTVLQPSTEFLVDTAIIHHVKCYGDSTGSILALPSGGDHPYNFHWSSAGPGNGAISPGINDLPLGTYTLLAEDGNGCQRTVPFYVSGPEAPITIEVLDSVGVTCFGYSDGAIDINIFGGTPDYSVNWNNISGEEDLTDAPAGHYLLSIFDSLGCHFTTNLEIGSPPSLQVSTTSSDQTQLFPPNGEASAVAIGGTMPYNYQWTNNAMSPVISEVPAGTYGVTVTDANQCEATQWVLIDLMLKTGEAQSNNAFELAPNPTNGAVVLRSKTTIPNAITIQVFSPIGQLVYLSANTTLPTSGLPLDLTGLVPGLYHVRASMVGNIIYEGKVVVVR